MNSKRLAKFNVIHRLFHVIYHKFKFNIDHNYSFFQNAAKLIKETMDKKFGASWHAVVGEGFGFELTHEVKNLLYMFFGGNMAIIIWKCS